MHWCFKFYFRSQQLRFGPGIIITLIWPLLALTGDSQYFKLGGGVLYHCTSGRICHAPGQDPSHSDNDVTQYMQQGLLRHMVYSSEEVLSSICPFASVQTCFHLDWFRPSRPLQTKCTLGYRPWISQPWPDLWDLLLWKELSRSVPNAKSTLVAHTWAPSPSPHQPPSGLLRLVEPHGPVLITPDWTHWTRSPNPQ